jgi:hypothetical protein
VTPWHVIRDKVGAIITGRPPLYQQPRRANQRRQARHHRDRDNRRIVSPPGAMQSSPENRTANDSDDGIIDDRYDAPSRPPRHVPPGQSRSTEREPGHGSDGSKAHERGTTSPMGDSLSDSAQRERAVYTNSFGGRQPRVGDFL